MTVGTSLAYFLHQYGQHEQVTDQMVEDLLESLKADLARTAQPADGTEPDASAELMMMTTLLISHLDPALIQIPSKVSTAAAPGAKQLLAHRTSTTKRYASRSAG